MKLAIFSGTSEHTIDAKNRLAVPKKFRERIDPEVEGAGLYVVPGRPSTYLWLYTERRFEEISNQWSSDLIPDSDRLYWEQTFFPEAERVEFDGQGRVLLPDRLIQAAGLGREVLICGVRDHIEIRPKGASTQEKPQAGPSQLITEAERRLRESVRPPTQQ